MIEEGYAAPDTIEAAVAQALDEGLRTPDIHTPGTTLVGCAAMGERITEILGG